jgi:large subunit ribosomal protein L32
MAVPKKKTSRSRRNMRRFSSFNRLEKPTTNNCPSCSEPKRPHRICSCGFYDGKAVLASRQKAVAAQA